MESPDSKAEHVAIWAANIACVIIALILVAPLFTHFV